VLFVCVRRDDFATVYYLPGPRAGTVVPLLRLCCGMRRCRPAMPASRGNKRFGFKITGTTNIPVVVEAVRT